MKTHLPFSESREINMLIPEGNVNQEPYYGPLCQ